MRTMQLGGSHRRWYAPRCSRSAQRRWEDQVTGAGGGAAAAGRLFLLGAARSGTTLLYKALCLHPDVAYISNWTRKAPAAPVLAVLNRLPPYAPATRRAVWFGPEAAN